MALMESVVEYGVGNRALVGEPRVGKSSIARRAYSLAGEKGSCVCIWVDISTGSLEQELFDLVFDALDEAGLVRADAISSVSSFASVKRVLSETRLDGKRVLLVLDEFDGASELANAAVNIRRLRELIGDNQRFALNCVIVARRHLRTIEMQISNLSTLDGVCSTVPVRPFRVEELHEMVSRAWMGPPADRIAATVYELLGGHPYFSEMYLFYLFEGMSDTECLERVRYELAGYFRKLEVLLAEDGLLGDAIAVAKRSHLSGVTDIAGLIAYGICRKRPDGDVVLWTPLFRDYLLGHTPERSWTTD